MRHIISSAAGVVALAFAPALSVAADRDPPAFVLTLPAEDRSIAEFHLFCPNSDRLQIRVDLKGLPFDPGPEFSIMFQTSAGEDDLPGFTVPGEDGATSLVVDYEGSTAELLTNIETRLPGSQAEIIFGASSSILKYALPDDVAGSIRERYRTFCAGPAQSQ